MNDPIEDKTIILIIIATILFVFCLVFTVKNGVNQLNPPIEWRGPTQSDQGSKYLDKIESLQL